MAKDSAYDAKSSKKKKSVVSYWFWRVSTVLLILALAGFGGFYFKKYQDLKNHPLTGDQAAAAELQRTIDHVSKLYGSLPANEKPQLATVTDVSKLKDQAFYDKAQNGDIRLLYVTAKLAILYRPSTNKIINVSSVAIQDAVIKVKVIGSSGTALSKDTIKDTVIAAYKDGVNVTTGDDSKNTFSTIQVIDLTGNNASIVSKIAETIKGQVVSLPSSESAPPNTDILIIVAGP